ncbi:hypothetical protein Cs7R123_46290 [Catellatospora sp. TT07R-123]|uniref:hypothetical protein n=1 Tax=Catellatospora sp. TT07R-123 TaxID=2733863 RepID=UPI001B0595DE|nr:hypothetical protein [Catellatospora sp. TT07R-123]GHJ47287.1 hypothetical protein Cs7R123_46290 [Catellatospora sp. TT07R-123]
MKFYELIGVIWICGMVVIALTWIVLRHRREQARTAAAAAGGSAELADLRARVARIEALLAETE